MPKNILIAYSGKKNLILGNITKRVFLWNNAVCKKNWKFGILFFKQF